MRTDAKSFALAHLHVCRSLAFTRIRGANCTSFGRQTVGEVKAQSCYIIAYHHPSTSLHLVSYGSENSYDRAQSLKPQPSKPKHHQPIRKQNAPAIMPPKPPNITNSTVAVVLQ